jgi:hypothetical protein
VSVGKRRGNRSQSSQASNVVDAINEAYRGDFAPLLRDCEADWQTFIRERIDLGADQLMIRIEMTDEGRPWCAWLVCEVVSERSGIAISQVMVPQSETDAALAIPEGYEQVPYFGIRWP